MIENKSDCEELHTANAIQFKQVQGDARWAKQTNTTPIAYFIFKKSFIINHLLKN